VIPIRDTVRGRYPPLATMALIAVNVLVFLLELALDPADLERVIYLFGVVPARFTHPDWAARVGFPIDSLWPFVTSLFLHGSWLHLIANMWSLWIFGDNVEDRMGPVRFVAFYLVCGVAAGVTHWLTNRDAVVPAIGASGAIAGVMGAYLVLYPRARIITLVPIIIFPVFIEVPAVVFLLVWYFSQLLGGLMTNTGDVTASGIAFWAHVGGFVAGIVLHRLFIQPSRRPRSAAADELGIEGAWEAATRWA
jgi:membrane associated rhomboid family serine protease